MNTIPEENETNNKPHSETIKTPAWLIPVTQSVNVAISINAFQEIIFRPEVMADNKMPSHIQHFINWKGSTVPIIDTQYIANAQSVLFEDNTNASFAIFAYTDEISHKNSQDKGVNDEQVNQYIAIPLITDPKMIDVSDDDFCDLPISLSHWKDYAISCFSYLGGQVPIISLGAFFAIE